MYPPDFACTLARFLCMYFVRIGEYFEVLRQGFSEIVLQIPLETAIFTERILRKERATLFELTCASISVTGRESAQACTRAKACKEPCTPCMLGASRRARDPRGIHPAPLLRRAPIASMVQETRRAAVSVFVDNASPLADPSRSCGIRSGEPGTDVHNEPQSACGLCQAPQADLLPPVPLVALNLLLGHA